MERIEALEMLKKYTKNKNLVKHGLAVEAVMRQFAKINGEDENYWGNIGLLHDIDYELYPEEHCIKCSEILGSENVPEDIIKSIRSHGYGICIDDVKPEHFMEKVLYAIDELTGLVIATALMKPNKKLDEVDVASVNKKWKTKGFAAGVNRELIQKGVNDLELELDYVIEQTLVAMQSISEDLGL